MLRLYEGSQACGVHLHEATERNTEEIAENASETSKVPVDRELPQRRIIEVSGHAKPSVLPKSTQKTSHGYVQASAIAQLFLSARLDGYRSTMNQPKTRSSRSSAQ